MSIAPILALTAFGWAIQAAPATAPVQQQAAPAKAEATPAKLTQSQKTAVVRKRAARPPAKPAAPAPPPKPPWEEFKLNGKTTMFLDFTEANPDMVISIFARTSGITILKDPTFKTPLTVTSAKAVKLDEAFEIFNTVLNLNQYELQKKGRLMIVAKLAPPAPPAPPAQPRIVAGPPPGGGAPGEEPVIKVYHLKFANASTIARVVNETFTQQQLEQIMQQLQPGQPMMPGRMPGMPGQPQPPKIVRASSDDYSNAVVVNAPKKYQDMAADLINQLDIATDMPLETQIFKLKYVTADEVVDAVTDVLTANSPTGRGSARQDQNQNQNFFYYNPFANSQQKKAGGQSAIAVKQTNSVIVSATKENMDVVKKLIEDLDQEASWVGTTFVIQLHYAKAADVATLLNQAFTQRRDQNQSPFFYIFSDYGQPNQKKTPDTDINDQGEVVNVRDLTGKVNVIADPNTNSLIVVTMPSNMKLIQKVVDKIDEVSPQVMIEAVIVEANLERKDQLGVEWNFTQNKILGEGTSATGSTNFGLQTSTTALQGLSYTLNGNTYKAFLNALQTDTRFKVLSSPRIFASNNVKATINVSEKLPYINNQQEGALGNIISNYDFLNVGVILNVTPRITASGEVAMDVDQTASDLEGFTTYNAPIVNNREATSTVTVKDGDTVVLGGIISTTKNKTVNKVPLLGDIPLIGNLFKNTTNDIQRTELIVLLTPHIVRTPEDAQHLRDAETKKLSKESQGELKGAIHP
jgi:general secretion pathway protein D